jgi:DNA polymerase III gamma/tau subunit
MSGLYQKHRPTTFEQVVGQPGAVAALTGMRQAGYPHAMLFVGPSGSGKTTLARIVKDELGCAEVCFQEFNAADRGGVDDMRTLQKTMHLSPMGGKARVYLIDECHKLTDAGQQILLKMCEDTPRHVYFLFCTTDPNKLLRTLAGRCAKVTLGPVPQTELAALVKKVAKLENLSPPLQDSVLEKIVDAADGSAREALVMLEQVAGLKTEKERHDAILPERTKAVAYDVFKLLMYGGGWNELAAVLRTLEDDPEKVRRLVLACATTVMVGKDGKGPQPKQLARAHMVINAFAYDYFQSGKAGLVASCYEVAKAL